MYVLTETLLAPCEEFARDEEIVTLIVGRGGDELLFARLYRKHFGRIFALAYGMTGRRDAAEDLTQEIFLRAHNRLETFDKRASFATWLHRIAVNHCLNHCRRERWRRREANIQETESLAPVDISCVERRLLEQQIQTQVRAALMSLKPKLRLLIVMKDVEGLSYEEMAERLNCSTGTIASSLSRARKLLARKLEGLKGKI